MSLRIAVAVLLAALVAGCGATSRIPESSLSLRYATTNALVATTTKVGTVTLTVGDAYPIIVIRTFRNDTGSTENADVTQFASFKWHGTIGVAEDDGLGNINALAAGTALLEVKFRESVFDPWDTVKLNVVVN